MVNVRDVLYRLECGQVAKAAETRVAGKLHCGMHDCMEMIVGIVINEWRAKCYTCRFARWAGLSQGTAEVFADGHRSRNSGHSVQAEFAANPAAVSTARKRRIYLGGT